MTKANLTHNQLCPIENLNFSTYANSTLTWTNFIRTLELWRIAGNPSYGHGDDRLESCKACCIVKLPCTYRVIALHIPYLYREISTVSPLDLATKILTGRNANFKICCLEVKMPMCLQMWNASYSESRKCSQNLPMQDPARFYPVIKSLILFFRVAPKITSANAASANP